MIVCDKCGKPVYNKANLTVKIKSEIKMERNKLYNAIFPSFVDYDIKYDLCQKCLDDVLKNLREFIHQGKFYGELNNG